VPAVDGGTVIGGRGLLFMRQWDYAVLERAIAAWCAGIDAPDVASASCRLARVMDWEFQHEYDEAIDLRKPYPRPSPRESDGR
jgi:hypothetical protein